MRLIDADELIERMDALKWKIASDTTSLEMIGIKFANEMNNNLLVIVSNMPTAYNVDAVVEELNAKSDFYEYEDGYLRRAVALKDAIEIVRKGGLDE